MGLYVTVPANIFDKIFNELSNSILKSFQLFKFSPTDNKLYNFARKRLLKQKIEPLPAEYIPF